jgi:octaprenyl-diphosphate synthase
MDLKEIQAPVKDLLEESNSFLKEKLKGNMGLINRLRSDTPITKGKKIRSTLLFLLAGTENLLSRDLPKIAASLEMLHLSSLVHDDIVDNSEFRRGQKTMNYNFGNFISVLWGDFLFITSLNIFSEINQEFTNIVLKCARAMIEGQLLEAENTSNFDIEEKTYFDIIIKKTSSLFGGIGEIASKLNGGSGNKTKGFFDFALDFGTMFQISDDMLDIFSDNSGKDRFRDLKEGKITLPIILLLKNDARHVVENFSEDNKELLLNLLKEYKIGQLSLLQLKGYYDKCADFLNSFPDSVYKKSLLELLNFVTYRDY